MCIVTFLPCCIECRCGLRILSVCLSVKRVDCDKMEERSVQSFVPYERSFSLVFTALHAMQTRYNDENSVRPSVRPSVKRVDCDKTEERSVQSFVPYERSFSLVFTALHAMQTRYNDEKSVRLSVCHTRVL